jgi:hypothetical protein
MLGNRQQGGEHCGPVRQYVARELEKLRNDKFHNCNLTSARVVMMKRPCCTRIRDRKHTKQFWGQPEEGQSL